MVRRIDVAARGVHWSEGGALVCIATDASFYMLEYQRDVAESVLASGQVRRSAPRRTRGEDALPARCLGDLLRCCHAARAHLPASPSSGPAPPQGVEDGG